MTRYDIDTTTTRGYVIFEDGVPFQVMYRGWWSIHNIRKGFDNAVCWLLPVDGPMPADIAMFVCTNFAFEIVTEFKKHGEQRAP